MRSSLTLAMLTVIKMGKGVCRHATGLETDVLARHMVTIIIPRTTRETNKHTLNKHRAQLKTAGQNCILGRHPKRKRQILSALTRADFEPRRKKRMGGRQRGSTEEEEDGRKKTRQHGGEGEWRDEESDEVVMEGFRRELSLGNFSELEFYRLLPNKNSTVWFQLGNIGLLPCVSSKRDAADNSHDIKYIPEISPYKSLNMTITVLCITHVVPDNTVLNNTLQPLSCL
jgi:hypothetical protein